MPTNTTVHTSTPLARTAQEELDSTSATLQKAASNTASTVAESASAVKTQVGESAREMGDAASREAARIGDLVRSWIERQTDMARSAAGTVREEATAVADKTQRYVRDEPVKSVLLAAAAGALLTGLVVLATRRKN
jgi:ElaB/YqjD/DUF883 family membrane-anchored ribosome-binding protein